ncbi:hypothetical protein [Gottfriedia acidiceleris]|uniref:hypothetical protein n=1 Tax=Gottfriedia acidiceleris TaxID=371036 RepID=UPI003D1E74D9
MRDSHKSITFFTDKYVEIININDEPDVRLQFRDDCRRLNRILKRENLQIDMQGNTLIVVPATTEVKKDKTIEHDLKIEAEEKSDIKISNFCVIPTHRLYIKNEEGIFENGIGLKIFVKISKKKFKCIYLNVTNEMLEKGDWINPTYLDHDLFLYNKSSYNQLKIGIKLSSRILSSDEFKIFDGEWWLENRFSDVEISDFDGFHESNSILFLAHPLTTSGKIRPIQIDNRNETNNAEEPSVINQDILYFLQTINELVEKELILDLGVDPENNENIGWIDKEKYYLLYRKTWDWVNSMLKQKQYLLSISEKELDKRLFEEGIIEIEEEKRTGRKRADCNVTVFPKNKERVFKISIPRLTQYLYTYDNQVIQ